MFFREHIDSNFGDLGNAVKALMGDFQRHHQSTSDLRSGGGSVEDIQRIVENFPELKKRSNDVRQARELRELLGCFAAPRGRDGICGNGKGCHCTGASRSPMLILRCVTLRVYLHVRCHAMGVYV